MNKSAVPQFFKSFRNAMVKHSPEILTGFGIAGMITTTVLAIGATPKALKLIEDEKNRQNYEICKDARNRGLDSCEHIERLKPVEVIKTTWKCYIPAAVTGVTSVACLIGANSIHARRHAALATAYQLSTTALNEYKDKVIETIGERKEKTIREKIDKDHVDKNPVNPNGIIVTKKGSTLFMDGFSNNYFESDIEEVKSAINRLNAYLVREGEACLNDLYDELNLDHSDIGYKVGWNANRVGRELIELNTTAQIASDGRPCIVVNCNPAPEWNYSRY